MYQSWKCFLTREWSTARILKPTEKSIQTVVELNNMWMRSPWCCTTLHHADILMIYSPLDKTEGWRLISESLQTRKMVGCTCPFRRNKVKLTGNDFLCGGRSFSSTLDTDAIPFQQLLPAYRLSKSFISLSQFFSRKIVSSLYYLRLHHVLL